MSKRTRAHQEPAEEGGDSDKEEGGTGGSLADREEGRKNSSSDASFHPQKTSTQVSKGKRGRPATVVKKANATRKISRIQPISYDSDSESDENDELLQSLMSERELPSRFTGLSQLTRSRQAVAMQASRSGKKKEVEGEYTETGIGGKKPPRKSVTFVKEVSVASPRRNSPRSTANAEVVPAQDDSEPSESEQQAPPVTSSRRERKSTKSTSKRASSVKKSQPEDEVEVVPAQDDSEPSESEQQAPPATSSRRGRKSTKSTSKRASSVKKPQPPILLPEDEVEVVEPIDDDGTAPKASTANMSRKSPGKPRESSDANETSKASSSGPRKRGRPKLSDTKRKSILKEVSVVIQKEPSAFHSQWFVPSDISSLYLKRASSQTPKKTLQSPKKRETSRRSPLEEHEPARRQRRSQAGTAQNRNTTVSERRVEANEAVEMEFEDDGGSSQSDTGGPRSSPSSADSMRGVSAVATNAGDGEAGVSDTSRKPSIRKKRKRGITLASRTKRRKPAAKKTSDKDETVRPPEISSEEEGAARGLDLTLSAGGRRYRRLRAGPKKSHTPGVRRSSRTRLAPVRHWEGEEVEYDRRRSGELFGHPCLCRSPIFTWESNFRNSFLGHTLI